MKITDALRGEHGVFYAQFVLMQETARAAELQIIQAQGALLAAALVPHAQIENEILFPAIEAEIGEQGPTRVMREEHAQIEGMLTRLQTLREFTQAHDEIESKLAQLPNLTTAEEARALIDDMIYAAREHFAKEEQVLFPMCEEFLSARALTELGAQWAERRGVTCSL